MEVITSDITETIVNTLLSAIQNEDIQIELVRNWEYEITHGIFTPQLAGKVRQLGCPKIVLDHVCTFI